jgi:hypothetical protein
MGSLNDGSPRHAAFNSDVFPKGLDLRRSVINNDLGTYVAADAAVLRAGQFVSYNTGGFIVPSTGADTIGVSKWNKQQFGVSVNVDEAIVLVGTTPTNLARGNISNQAVRSAPNMGGTLFTGGGGDYNEVLGAGTIARDGTTTIPDGATVYVTYTYALTDADFEFDGRDFRNQQNNDVLGQENRLAVISDWSRLFNMEWDTSVTYTLTGATSKLFVSAQGKATSTSGTDFAGQVHQVPTADDPFLGMTLHGNPV